MMRERMKKLSVVFIVVVMLAGVFQLQANISADETEETTQEENVVDEGVQVQEEVQPALAGFVENVPGTIPSYYTSKTISDGDGLTLYSFIGRNGQNYYRLYGSMDGGVEGFYEANQYGSLVVPSIAIDVDEEYLTVAPYVFEAVTIPTEQMPSDTSFVKDETVSSLAGFDVYSYTDQQHTEAQGNIQYRSYGRLVNVSDPSTSVGWYKMNATGEPSDYEVITDIHKEVLNYASTGFIESAAPSTIPGYYGTPTSKAIDANTIMNHERVYGFTGKDGNAYYRVYGTVNGTNEGFYDADAYGNVKVPATLIDLTWEDTNLKPTENKPGGALIPDEVVITSVEINEIISGTPTWDTDDVAGNDSNATNTIIRSFDKATYSVDANAQIRSTSGYTSFTEGYIYFEAILPFTKEVGEFSLSDMNWIEDAKVTVVDGKQVLTGKRLVKAEAGTNAFPGTRQLIFSIQINGAKNGQEVVPTFTLWVDGNPNSDKKSINADKLTVSAAPKYNVYLSAANTTHLQRRAKYDMTTGEEATSSSVDAIDGRMLGYGVSVQLYNDTPEKGLKGIEIPQGDITFDIDLTLQQQELGLPSTIKDVTSTLTPQLWDYKLNWNSGTTGEIGRRMFWDGAEPTRYGAYTGPLAQEGATGDFQTIYNNPGQIEMSQNENSIAITLKDYIFDTFQFPTHAAANPVASPATYTANIGVFTAGYMQILVPFEENADKNYEYYLTLEDKNFSATSISGQTTTTQKVASDDKRTTTVALLLPGVYQKANYFTDRNGSNLSSAWDIGDGWAYRGRLIMIGGDLRQMTADGHVTDFNLLQKFDDEAFDIVPGNKVDSPVYTVEMPKIDKVTFLYAAKPDGTGWTSDQEMQDATDEDLVYYATIDELKADGKICVAFLAEGRGAEIKNVADVRVLVNAVVKDTAEIGKVYQTVNEWKGWTSSNPIPEELSHLNGDSFPKEDIYTSSNVNPSYKYGKTAYDSNGNMIAGTPAGHYFAGESLLIVGNEARIQKSVEQLTGTAQKAIYDLDAGQRIADFKLQPSIQLSGKSGTTNGEVRDTVTIIDKLPTELTYIDGTAMIGGTYQANTGANGMGSVTGGENVEPTITIEQDANGKDIQVLTWVFEDVAVGDSMPAIHYSTTIGKISDPENDVANGQSFQNEVRILAQSDGRAVNATNGNIALKGISVIKTNATAFSKAIDQNLYELHAPIGFVLSYGNESQNAETNVRMLDILPYTGDWRGSKFDGSYTVDTITLEYSATPTTTLDLSYTTDESIRNQSNTAFSVNASGFVAASKSVSGNTVTYTLPTGTRPTALHWTGTLDGNMSVKVRYALQVTDNKPANIYANDATVVAGASADPLYAPIVQARVARRTIEGVAWIDSNRNGKRETTELRLPDVKVTLYKSDGTKVTSDILGNDISNVVTDSNGAYTFSNLPSGEYYVQFDSYGDVDLSKYILTTKKATGVGDTVDSDADAVLNGSTLQSAKITGITTPVITDMKVMDYRVSNLDMGLYAPYTLTKTSDPVGSIDGSNPPVVKEGQVITYKITLDSPVANQSNVTLQDTIPEGMSLVGGSIRYQLAGGSSVTVSNAAYNNSSRTIIWPTLEIPKGTTTFTVKVVVNKLPEGVTEKTYRNEAIAKQPNIPDLPSTGVSHKVITREAEIHKTSVLLDSTGNYLTEDRGSKETPVYSELEQKIEYRIVVKNTGDNEAISGEMNITDILPIDTSYVEGSMKAVFRDSSNPTVAFPGSTATVVMSEPDSDGNMVWTLDKMKSGEEAYLTFQVTAPVTSDDSKTEEKELHKVFTNTAKLYDQQLQDMMYEETFIDETGDTHIKGDHVYQADEVGKTSETTYHVVKEPLLTIKKESNVTEGSYVSSDDEIIYEMTVTNTGEAIAKEVDIKDAIPENTKYVEGSISYSGDATTVTPDDSKIVEGTGELTWKVEGLDVNKSVKVTFTVKVERMEESGEREIVNQAYTRLPEDPWTPSNEIEHIQKVSYELEKTSTPENGSYVDGNDTITYFIKVTNTGESTLDSIQVKDSIPMYTKYVEGSIGYEGKATITPDDSQIVDQQGELRWDIEGIAVGESVIVSFEVQVEELKSSGERSIVNQAYGKMPEEEDWKPTNEIEHIQKLSYEITKASDPKTDSIVKEGDIITYFINVENTGEETLRDIIIKDIVPTGTSYVENSIYSAVENTKTSQEGEALTWEIEEIEVGEIGVVSFRVKVEGTTPRILNVATVEVGEDEPKDTNEIEHNVLGRKEVNTSDTTEIDSQLLMLGISLLGMIEVGRRIRKNKQYTKIS